MPAKVGPPDQSESEEAVTTDTYRNAGFGGGFERGQRPAVVIVDFSNGFTDPAAPTGADMSREIARTNELIAAAREIGAPVIFTTIAYDESPAGITWLRKARGMAALTKGSPLTAIDPRCDRAPGDPLIVKQHASAFFGTPLLSLLISSAVDMVVVCGATTSGCVRATAVDSVSSGFPTFVPRECVADRARGPHDAALFDLEAKYADVEPVAALIEHFTDLARNQQRSIR